MLELTPKADGTMAETRFHVDVDRALREMEWIQHAESVKDSNYGMGSVSSDPDLPDPSLAALEEDKEIPSSYPGSDTGGFRRTVSMAELAASELVVAREIHDNKGNQDSYR